MKPTKQHASTPSTPKTGLFVALRGLVRGRGSGAPKISIFATLVVGVALFALPGAALAAAPETPVTGTPSAITATTATLSGTLNPSAAGEPGEFQFAYLRSESKCEPGGTLAPEPAAPAAGAEKEPASTEVTGLQPNADYAFCLIARNPEGQATGKPVLFKTLAAPPSVDAESVSAVTGTEATLEAQVNPNNKETTVVIEYAIEEGMLGTLGATKLEVPGTLSGFGDQPVSAPTGAVLAPGVTYSYRAVATNSASEETLGPVQQFKTAIPPATPQATVAEPLGGTTATLNGILNPGAPGDPGRYQFVYRPSTTGECQGAGETLTEEAEATGEENETAQLPVEGLAPNTEYAFCLVAHNGASETSVSPAVSFTTTTVKPGISHEETANLTRNTVDLTANVNPEGSPTKFFFEYGTTTEYGSKTPAGEAGSGLGDTPVSVHLKELEENRTYHWRLVAVNTAGTTTGVDHTFIFPTEAEPLPDGRQYEMVTPTQKNAALFGSLFISLKTRISEDGTRVMAPSVQCFGDAEGCTGSRQNEGSPYEFHRTAAGWVTHSLALPATRFEGVTNWLYSVDIGAVLFSAPLSSSVSDEFYVRQPDGALEGVGPIGELGTYREIAGAAKLATTDFSHIVYQTSHHVWAFDASDHESVYEYVGAGNTAPELVGVTGGPGSHDLISKCGTRMFHTQSALSADGRTIYFTARPCETGGTGSNAGAEVPSRELWARIDEARSVFISAPVSSQCTTTACRNAPPSDPELQGASSDGERAFFTSTQQLTNEASEESEGTGSRCEGASGGGCNLYESICPDHCEDPAQRRLVDVSAGDTSGTGPQVQGVMAMPTSASHVYFVARGVLSSEPNSEGQSAEPGANNLYVYQDGVGTTPGHVTFIAQLANSDSREWSETLFANVTPDGLTLVFESHRALTKDDTRPEGPTQIYRYDARTRSLIRVSVGQGGFNDNGNAGLADAHIVEAKTAFQSGVGPARSNPTVSDDGSYVFFQSPVGLTPHALNDVEVAVEENPQRNYAQNIYEYHDGRVSLISDGKDLSARGGEHEYAVELLATSASGADVIFATADRLTSQDTDTQIDDYDAHICTAASPCTSPPATVNEPCSGEACHGVAQSAPAGAAPGSATFSGPGNPLSSAPRTTVKPKTPAQIRALKLASALTVCRREHQRHRRRICQARARKRFGPSKARSTRAARKGGN